MGILLYHLLSIVCNFTKQIFIRIMHLDKVALLFTLLVTAI